MKWLCIGSKADNHSDFVLLDIRQVGDIVGDIRKLELPDNSFYGIECHHVLEHLTPEDAIKATQELYRVAGQVLETSVPDMLACARTLLVGDLRILHNIYSPHPEEAQRHRWGYTKDTFMGLLKNAGFKRFEDMPTVEPHEIRIRAWK